MDKHSTNKKFIEDNMEHLSAVGWHFYQMEGRGSIVVESEIVSTWTETGLLLAYVSEVGLSEGGGDWPSPDVARMVRDYVPDREVVVIIKMPDGVESFRCRPDLSPPEAYKSLKDDIGTFISFPSTLH